MLKKASQSSIFGYVAYFKRGGVNGKLKQFSVDRSTLDLHHGSLHCVWQTVLDTKT